MPNYKNKYLHWSLKLLRTILQNLSMTSRQIIKYQFLQWSLKLLRPFLQNLSMTSHQIIKYQFLQWSLKLLRQFLQNLSMTSSQIMRDQFLHWLSEATETNSTKSIHDLTWNYKGPVSTLIAEATENNSTKSIHDLTSNYKYQFLQWSLKLLRPILQNLSMTSRQIIKYQVSTLITEASWEQFYKIYPWPQVKLWNTKFLHWLLKLLRPILQNLSMTSHQIIKYQFLQWSLKVLRPILQNLSMTSQSNYKRQVSDQW